ncbi:PEP/pyruvate-binding domain-containing protein [Desulfatiglans anilini]|uniref:PEP/pyruvate-binding domain-containing protein n=1 Tax=Desulfatiglans anilini TaxID=90728 RepID=UPI000414ACA6|nr:PEP/pyruvate-binding domain-containing protein [Desulfatiglans anilini]
MLETRPKILFFEKCGRQDTNLVGGKCANLGEMYQLGLPVPPGFAVSTAVYDAFIHTAGITARLEQITEQYDTSLTDIRNLTILGDNLQEIIMECSIPDELRVPIEDAYAELSNRLGRSEIAVAVRSSGVAEDSATASFAGQYESYLNIIGKDAVLRNIQKCWASAFSPRCISYRLHNGLGILAGSISVAVQKMVNARSAGVGFTANPNTGDKGKVVIEGNWGCGESVVQGISKVDIFSVEKTQLEILESQVNKKTKQIILKNTGVEEAPVDLAKQLLPCIDNKEILQLAKIARNAENHYGLPLDLEWVIDADLEFPQNVFFVQARPITVIAKQKTATEAILDMACTRLFPVNE